MSLKARITDKAFAGRKNIFANVIEVATTPTASKPIGTLAWDSTNDDAYIATSSTGTWVKINA